MSVRALALLFTASLVLSACSVFPGSEPSFPTRGLVSHYPLNGDGRDAQRRNPLVLAGTQLATDRFGREDFALAFGDGTDRATVQDPVGLDFDLRTDSYTVAMWVQSDNVRASRLIQKWDELSQTPYAFSLQTDATGLDGVVYDRSEPSLVRVPRLWDGEWHHVAVTFDARGSELVSYRDGVEVERKTVTVRATTRNAAPLTIGGPTRNVQGRSFTGSVDDIFLYERALSAREIRSLQ